jgi:hypothetical protein
MIKFYLPKLSFIFLVVLEIFLLIIVGELFNIDIDILFCGSFYDRTSLYLDELMSTNLSWRIISVSFYSLPES